MNSELIILGTGNAMCTRCYNTCFYIRTPKGGLLTDAGGGNGIFRQLYKGRISFEEIHHIFVTHVHTDHILGVVWLIRKISPLMHKERYPGHLTIYCHNEVKHTLLTICELLLPRKIFRAVGDTIILREITDGERLEIDDMQLTCFDIGSTKVKQFGYQAILPDQQSLVCLGDEPYNERNRDLVEGCDWLLSEAFCLDADQAQFRPYEKHHSTALDAARTAQHLGAKNLVLYHTEDTRLAARQITYTEEARRVFSGNIFVPNDLEIIPLSPTT